MKVTENNGKCDACHLDILKGEDYREYTDNDDFYRLHEPCADLIEDGGEMPIPPDEALDDLIYWVYGLSTIGKALWDIVKDEPQVLARNGDEAFFDVLNKWRIFIIKKGALAKTNKGASP